ncbi:MAG: hypothetical protein B7Y07_08135 [Halothiobacillus sp. 24-54-40]|jgi:hypothetical protein|nr:MAG: hypothetical protein B7X12_06945 [Halothiobacillus sp. 20-53-49]OYY37316.1 MAG: hypothetical protein B7Y58_06435 [Halothiobacillus sp. 35-54-62]OYY56868.1 MAG: hypothetical protein B7Y53_00860 [Halothiobacillus sp. 28-55-5]OYZ86426.1 MAG: hypothetical protein B7Y07_08135 [Halothiobacillus sp. 24-54-40]OZA80325.1 MAG: hypothetical protein B7X64_06345 [Halothiobacillus sp. 39-53-45]HQS03175.1 conjugal transfer protein TraD [Halothiobacillus sp.]
MNSSNNKETSDVNMSDLREKIILAEESGGAIEFTADEARLMGAFIEDAINEADAEESNKGRE